MKSQDDITQGGATLCDKLDCICEEIFERWDKDMRAGKLLTALAGRLPGYRKDIDLIRAALKSHTVAVPSPD